MKLHFISGLPRSGSTLLAAILKQNPRFTAGMTSPVAAIYQRMELAMAQSSDGSVFVTDEKRKRILRGVIENYYEDTGGIVFDTSRMWAARLPALSTLFQDAKVICCVRDLPWIFDSFERLHIRNAFEPSGIYGYNTNSTVYTRADGLASSSGVVGYACDAMREALAGEYADRLHLVEYEDLCKSPAEALARIYTFIGEPVFEHDFEHVTYSASEFDKNIGARGLHDVNGRVEWCERRTILPPDLFARYSKDEFWRKPEASVLKVVHG